MLELRQRKPIDNPEPVMEKSSSKKSTRDLIHDEDRTTMTSIVFDTLRMLLFLIVFSCGLSYVLSGGKSMLWSNEARPKYLKSHFWKVKFSSPVILTDSQLAAYNGANPALPLYLAINGTIYDVSANSRIYGLSGSYNLFTGRDASRAFITGCFATDLTPNLRGVEQMFLPEDDPAVDTLYSPAELQQVKEEEQKQAREAVNKALDHWMSFFAKSDKYLKVGYVKREPGWLEKLETPELCEQSLQNRPKRKAPSEK